MSLVDSFSAHMCRVASFCMPGCTFFTSVHACVLILKATRSAVLVLTPVAFDGAMVWLVCPDLAAVQRHYDELTVCRCFLTTAVFVVSSNTD